MGGYTERELRRYIGYAIEVQLTLHPRSSDVAVNHALARRVRSHLQRGEGACDVCGTIDAACERCVIIVEQIRLQRREGRGREANVEIATALAHQGNRAIRMRAAEAREPARAV